MSQFATPDGLAGHRGHSPVGGIRRSRPALLVAGSLGCLIALLLLAGGAWALWEDRVDRDGEGFVSFGNTELQTDQYAIVGDLRGDGPSWLYGSTVMGDERVRATSEAEQPLFIGIAREDDVLGYLEGAGYATVEGFEVRADTTHPGGPPTGRPSGTSIWATSMQGTGEQTVRWAPRSGDWSIVFMNADASAGVDVRGDASAELPLLPWLAAGFLIVAAAAGLAGVWTLRRAIRRAEEPPTAQPLERDESRESTSENVAAGARG